MISIDEKMLEKAIQIDVNPDVLDFEEIDENEMQKIMMQSAQDAADMIAQMPDATTVTGVLSTLNMSMLQQEIERYIKLFYPAEIRNRVQENWFCDSPLNRLISGISSNGGAYDHEKINILRRKIKKEFTENRILQDDLKKLFDR